MSWRVFFGLAVVVALAGPAPHASAMTITNDHTTAINVWIQNWLYRLRPGKSTEFIPTESPVDLIIEVRPHRITCTAKADSEVRITQGTCYVDGEATGESQFQL